MRLCFCDTNPNPSIKTMYSFLSKCLSFYRPLILYCLILFTLTSYTSSIIKTCSFESQSENYLDFKCLIHPDLNNSWIIESSSNKSVPPFKENDFKFALLENADKKPFKASLLTTQFSKEVFGCVSFWYYGPVSDNTIRVSINGNPSEKIVRTQRNNTFWTYFETGYFSNKTEHQVSITAEVKESNVSVTDIEYGDEPCKNVAQMCTFSHGLCSFHSASKKKWKQSRNKTLSKHSFVSVDFDGTDSSADLLSTVYPVTKTKTACIDFKYLFRDLEQSNQPKLDVKIFNLVNGSSKSVWSTIGQSNNSSFFERKVLQVSGLATEWRVQFSVDFVNSVSGFAALTDILIDPNHCQENLDCNFESGTCLWDIVNLDLDETSSWRRKTWETFVEHNSTSFNLPSEDVTLKSSTGSYFFVAKLENDQVNLTDSNRPKIRSQVIFHPVRKACFSLWLFTNSLNEIDSQLEVTFMTDKEQTILKAMPAKSDLKLWKRILYDLSFDSDTHGYFEITKIDGDDTSLAFDEIGLDFKECNRTHGVENLPDIANVPKKSILNCDFDYNNPCHYIIPAPFEGNLFNWKLVSDYPGPGHDSKEIHQEFLVSSNFNGLPAVPRTFTEFSSPPFNSSCICFLRFNFSTQGDYEISLRVQSEHFYEIWHKKQFQSEFMDWRQFEVALSPSSDPVRLNFRSERRDGFIAIDQIQLTHCDMPLIRPRMCSFESSSASECSKQWISPNVTSTSDLFKDGPTRDANLSRSGKVVLLRDGQIKSHKFMATKSCVIQFHYMVFNTSLEVSFDHKDDGKSKVQKVLKSDPDNYAFKEFSWTVDGSQQITADYITLSIKSVSADKHNSYAAIDNTFFSEGCQFFFAQNSDPKKGKFFL